MKKDNKISDIEMLRVMRIYNNPNRKPLVRFGPPVSHLKDMADEVINRLCETIRERINDKEKQ